MKGPVYADNVRTAPIPYTHLTQPTTLHIANESNPLALYNNTISRLTEQADYYA